MRGPAAAIALAAPAKLTLSLRVTGVRPDGYHLLEAEMVTLDLADTLVLEEGGSGLAVTTEWPGGAEAWRDVSLGRGADNLVVAALAAVGRTAGVRLVKRVPPGAGLGGGSADAAAVLRWAGCTDPAVAAGLGADVPFCVAGGRALVRGVGEVVAPLVPEERAFVLLLPPFGVPTAAVYRAYDALAARGHLPVTAAGGNDLEAPALHVEPRLAGWRAALEEATGRPARLAGSGSTWFVEGEADALGVAGRAAITQKGERALLVPVRTTPPAG